MLIKETAGIGDHDLDTKRRQAEKLPESGKAVQFVVKLNEAKEEPQAIIQEVPHWDVSSCRGCLSALSLPAV